MSTLIEDLKAALEEERAYRRNEIHKLHNELRQANEEAATLRDENAKLRAELASTLVDYKSADEGRTHWGKSSDHYQDLLTAMTVERDALARAVADAEVALDYMNLYSWDFRYQAKGAAALERFRNRNKPQEEAT